MSPSTKERLRALNRRVGHWAGIRVKDDEPISSVFLRIPPGGALSLLDLPEDIRAELRALLDADLAEDNVYQIVSCLARDRALTTEEALALIPHARGHNTAMGTLLAHPATPEEAVVTELSGEFVFGVASFVASRHAPLSPAFARRLIEILSKHRAGNVASVLRRPEVGPDVVREFLVSSGTRNRDVLAVVGAREDLRNDPEIRRFLLGRLRVDGVAAALAEDLRPDEFTRIYSAFAKRGEFDAADAYVEKITATGELSLEPDELARLFAGGELTLHAMELLRRVETKPVDQNRTHSR